MKKGLQTTFLSIAGVAVVAVILIAVNWIGSRAKFRLDLTQEKAYTLSPGTRAILAKLDTPVQVRLYVSRREAKMPIVLANYARVVEDLLEEFREASKGHLEIQKLDPEPDSDAEESAKKDGMEARQVSFDGDSVYLGFSVTMLDSKESEPFLNPAEERELEYRIARAISRVITKDKPVLGVMTPLQMAGGMTPMSMRTGQAAEPWLLYRELKGSYNVKTVEMTADKIPDDIKTLLVIHPKAITETTQWAIDQFVLRGGKLILVLDPLAILDAQGGGPFGGGGGSSSNAEKLLAAWGLKFDSTKVVADMTYAWKGRRVPDPTIFALTELGINQPEGDLLMSGIKSMFLPNPGVFTGTPAEGLKQTVLFKSSKDSQLVDPMTAQMAAARIKNEFAASGIEYPLAVRLEGKFKTAFPNGKPNAPPPPNPDEKKPEAPAAEQGLKESAVPGKVVLIGDSDFLQDQAVTEQDPQTGMIRLRGNNLAFALGTVDQLAGDENLISVRSRALRDRPFTVVNKIQEDAEAKYRTELNALEKKSQELRAKIATAMRASFKPGEQVQQLILPPDVQRDIKATEDQALAAEKQRKQLSKDMRADVDALETKVQWLNIAVMPAVVILLGVFLAIVRRYKTAAT